MAENLICDLCGGKEHKKIENRKGQVFYYCLNEGDLPNTTLKCRYENIYGTSAEGKWIMPDGRHYNGVVKYIENPANAYLANACPYCDNWFSVSGANTWEHCDDCYDDEDDYEYEAESFDAEVKDRHPTLSKKAKSEYVFPERKAYPIGDEKHAMLALVYSTWPNNKKDASEVRRKVFQRYPQLRTEFMDGKYETRNAESFDADWDNAPYGSWDEAWSDEISFPMGEKPEKLWLKNLSVIAVLAGAIWVGKQTRK